MYFFNYLSTNLTRASFPLPYRPRLKIGPASTTNRFTINVSSVSFNPKDQKAYYIWTDYAASPVRSYIWRWRPDTTFAAAGALLDTIRSFAFDIGGVTFDNTGLAWQLEFPAAPCSRAFLRQLDFTNGTINGADTIDFTTGAGGIGDTIFVPGNGDITLLPSGQMYFNFDNKLYTPDYLSYGNATHHIKGTYIDSTRLPTGAAYLVGLSYSDGDLIAAYSPTTSSATSCRYRRLNPVTGDTNFISYSFTGSNGVRSVDMAQIASGVGASKKLVSITPTGTANQYDVVYQVYTKNYGTIPITNIMVKDSLGGVNGNANVSNVSTAFVGTPPAGFVLNPAFNGTTNTNLINAGATLKNYPTDSSYFTINISARFSNIQAGVIYYNSAVVTANGFNNRELKDSSTNGSNPDLNQNDKPDDVGESQPTPFLVSIVITVPPCAALDTILYNQTFGTGVGMSATLPAVPSASTLYTGASAPVMSVGRFTVTDSAQRGNPTYWNGLRDHTGNVNGKMLVVNADAPATIIYRDTLPVSCPGQQYSLSFWTAFIGNSTYQTLCNGLGGFKFPRFLVRTRDLSTGLTVTSLLTDSIVSTAWVQRGMKWIMPAGYSSLIVEILNAGAGGCGNDFAIDDIQYGICDPLPTISTGPQAGCVGGTTTFISALTDGGVIPGAKDYQWQVAPTAAGPWVNIGGASASTYTINPLLPADTGKFYRVIVAASGNIGNPICQYISPSVKLTGFSASTAAAFASRNKNNICPGKTVQLAVVGGTLGASAKWYWYTGSCGGTLIDSGATINVTPAATTTYYVRAIGMCNTTSCVSVTVNISCDIDKDDDGIPDFVESTMAAAFLDANSNGVINAFDPTYIDAFYGAYKDNNNDYIDDDFQADGDSDNDGIANWLDPTFPGRIDTNADGKDDRFDTDLDGVANYLDLDSDNDGIPDVVEAYGVDANGDGKIDNYTDTDGDGLSQNVDFNNTGANISGLGLGLPDLDGDGVPNFIDLDSDQDGIPDLVESGGADVNNNGKIDGAFIDVNGDGLHDSYINAGALLLTGADAGGDGRADTWPNKNMDRDLRPNAYDMDADGDGIIDVIEAGLPDTDFNGRVDGIIGANGWSTTVSAMPGPLAIRNTDADGRRDYLDIDSDGDGIPDNIEGMSTAGYFLPTSNDADGDGLMAPYDNVVGFGGSGVFVYDHDGDGTPDYRDLDTDADGQPDIVEGNDFNLNGTADDNVTPTGIDTDGDGLDNRFDSIINNLVVDSIKGTSYNMGNGGSTSGDTRPGARCPVQKKTVGQTDRDWRYVGIVLPIQFLKFTGTALGDNVLLNWTISTPKEIDRFEIERSIDNSIYYKTGTVKEKVLLNQPQSFAFNDDIRNVNNNIIYYRLKVFGKSGEIKYSNILVVRRIQTKTPVSIVPNPAYDYVSIRFFVEKDGEITLRLTDNLGKLVLMQKQKVIKGNNTLQLSGLSKYSAGVYSLQVFVNDEITTEKLILSK